MNLTVKLILTLGLASPVTQRVILKLISMMNKVFILFLFITIFEKFNDVFYNFIITGCQFMTYK